MRYGREIMSELRLRLHDTLRGELRRIEPKEPGCAGVYTCGPTVYDVAHVGHARAALAPDLLVRYLRAHDLDVRYVRNLTDVDDKILKRAAELGEPPMILSARMAKLYQEDIAKLGCLVPDVEPKVSEHIEHIVELVEKLITNEAAYVVDMPGGTRDVYFAVRAKADYGKLSKRKIDDLRVGARIEASHEKRDPLDFALWKGCTDDAWGWASPWGKGRPGWHIECSAMSSAYLGHGFDVHCGGMDLIFPHHENEIAQSEAADPGEGDYVRMWMHNGFVNIDKEKMSKSLGNFATIRDVYERYDPEALRYFLLGVQYRGPISFETDQTDDGRVVFPGVAEAERRVDYLYGTMVRLAELGADDSGGEKNKLAKELHAMFKVFGTAEAKMREAMDDDLNTPAALAVVAELAKQANELCDAAQKRRKDARFVAGSKQVAQAATTALRFAFELLGIVFSHPAEYHARTTVRRLSVIGLSAEHIEAKIAERVQARKDKDFERGDALRNELVGNGVELLDSPTGTTWRVQVL